MDSSGQAINLGRWGENQALRFYQERGFKLVTRNFNYYRQGRQGHLGEIDLIMQKQSCLYLVEVKTRTNPDKQSALAQVDRAKLAYLYKTYQYFLCKNPEFKNFTWQFDVALVLNSQIELIPNAATFESLY